MTLATSLKTEHFDFALPEKLIAQAPPAQRGTSRMLVMDRKTQRFEHKKISDLPKVLAQGDVLVANDTQVIPARVFGVKPNTGGQIEVLLLEDRGACTWDVLLRSSRRPKVGARFVMADGQIEVEMLEDGERGRALVRLYYEGEVLEILDRAGVPPLPPYIHRDPKQDARTEKDKTDYQTIFASNPGAVAAPTAGLHFTPPLLAQLDEKGVNRALVTLHVGLGTFRPVHVDQVADHNMESERYIVPEATATTVNQAKDDGRRIIAVGSTSTRTLEAVALNQRVQAGSGRSDLFIYPPYDFQILDGLLTNFHLPKSTLIMMVSAFAGRDFVMEAYQEAIRAEYRFYSYGDCMLIL